MKCKKSIIFSGLFCSCLLSLIFLSSSTFALSDYNGVLDTTTPVNSFICNNDDNTVPNCSDYNYIIFTPSSDLRSGTSASAVQIRFNFTSVLSRSNYIVYFGSTIPYLNVLNINTNLTSVSLQNIVYRGTLSYILTDTFPIASCPECEVCQQCPAIPENPYDDKLDAIIKAIYVCAGTVLVIYFFYCIYRIIIKGGKL